MLARQQADRGTTNMAAMNLNAGALAPIVNDVPPSPDEAMNIILHQFGK